MYKLGRVYTLGGRGVYVRGRGVYTRGVYTLGGV